MFLIPQFDCHSTEDSGFQSYLHPDAQRPNCHPVHPLQNYQKQFHQQLLHRPDQEVVGTHMYLPGCKEEGSGTSASFCHPPTARKFQGSQVLHALNSDHRRNKHRRWLHHRHKQPCKAQTHQGQPFQLQHRRTRYQAMPTDSMSTLCIGNHLQEFGLPQT
jgi:hypothetical protein